MISQIQLNGGAASVSFDTDKWSAPRTDGQGIITLDLLSGSGSASIRAERVVVDSGAVVDGLLEETRKKHGELTILLREKRTVRDCEVSCVKYSISQDGVPWIVSFYCCGGLAGTFRITAAAASAFAECESDFTELLNGLEIRPLRHAAMARIGQSMRYACRATRIAAPALASGAFTFFIRMNFRIAVLASAALAAGFFLAVSVYGLVKFK